MDKKYKLRKLKNGDEKSLFKLFQEARLSRSGRKPAISVKTVLKDKDIHSWVIVDTTSKEIVCHGIIKFGLQGFINIGVNMGLLPTKGLTLPLMSYGGSSMVVMCTAVALLLRVDHETRCTAAGMSASGIAVAKRRRAPA